MSSLIVCLRVWQQLTSSEGSQLIQLVSAFAKKPIKLKCFPIQWALQMNPRQRKGAQRSTGSKPSALPTSCPGHLRWKHNNDNKNTSKSICQQKTSSSSSRLAARSSSCCLPSAVNRPEATPRLAPPFSLSLLAPSTESLNFQVFKCKIYFASC